MTDKICTIIENLKARKPLVHCITNPISITQCANAVLSVGARPIMAEHPREVSEITCSSDALMLNTGNITDARMESMEISLKKAKENAIPSLLDAVGIACSGLRLNYVNGLLRFFVPSVIKGNYSEIMALPGSGYHFTGVDADSALDSDTVTKVAKKLALKYNTVILATGKTDVITNGKKTVFVKNGTPQLAGITGTGCMLGALCTAFLAIENPMDSAVAACVYLGICGQKAQTRKGNGSFMISLMDMLSDLDRNDIANLINIREG